MPADITIVLDTNVWISGIFFRRGIPAIILQAWRDQHFEIVATFDILKELEPKLQEKASQFNADPDLANEWLAYIKTFVRIVTPATTVSGVCRDPDDEKFLTAALTSDASYIISGDHDLQVLSEHQNVKVLSPREFAELLNLVAKKDS